MDNLSTGVSPRSTRPEQQQIGRIPAVLLLAGSCMPVMGALLLAPILPSMTAAFAGTPGVELLVPIVLTIPALMIAILAPFAGVVADRFGRKPLLLAAMVAYSIFGTAPLWLNSLSTIVASRVGLGIAEAVIMTVCTTLITDYYSGKQRDKYLGMQVLVASFAATAFVIIGGALGSRSWRTPFWVYAIAAVIAIPMAIYFWEPASREHREARTPVPWKQIGVPSLVTLFGGVVFYALIVHLPYILSDLGVTSVGLIGAGTALASAATAAGAFTFRFVSKHGPNRLLPAAFGLAGVGLAVVCLTSSIPFALVGAVITSFGTGLLLPTLLVWAVSGLALEQRGRGTGIWTGSLYIGQFASPIILGIVGSMLGGLPISLGILGGLSLIGAFVVILVSRRRHLVT